MLVPTGFGVALEAQHDLRSPIPSRSDIFSHVARILFGVLGESSCQTKVANLELAVGVNEEVARLKISMEDVGRVNVLQTAQDLVDKGLEVGVCEWLTRADDRSQITLHELC